MSRLRRKHKKSNIVVKILIAFIVIILISSITSFVAFSGLSLMVAGVILDFFSDLPDLADFSPTENALTSRIYAADGTLIATFHGEENREIVALEQVPQNLKNAVISIEDERFYQHTGVDIEGIIRSFLINLQTGYISQGASTLTQQYVKNVYIPEEKTDITYERKIKEATLAHQLEKIYTKDEILEMYLNTVYFGEGAYGVQAASKIYFNKNVEYLNLAECALIAGLPQIPSKSPYIDKVAPLERRNTVLAKMLELNYITEEEYNDAIRHPILLERPQEETEKGFALYFVEYVKQKLIEEYGVNRVFRGGFNIYTTLEPDMQIAAENAIHEILPDPEDPTAALVSMDPRNGFIKAMVGGKDFGEMKFNLATQGKRQPGSIFKIFALMAALEQGMSPYTTFNPNGTVVFDIVGSEPWEISNYLGTSYEVNELSIFEATVKSVNVVYAQVIMRVGAYSVVKMAKDMGITTPLNPYPAIGLGGLTIGVSTLETCTAFSTIANYGVRHDPVAILKVTDKDGNILQEYEEEKIQVLSAINAYRAIEILQQVMLRGTGTRARLDDRPCAGKTGTTQEAENAWFAGFTPNLAACVWIGYPEENIKMGVIHDMRVQGGAHPAMIWKLFMEEAIKNLPVEEFIRPQEDTVSIQITANPETGEIMIPNRFTPLEQITINQYRYGADPRNQAPVMPEDIPIMPMVSLLPINEANHILIESGYTHIEYKNEPFGEVPQGHTHRQDPMCDLPVETIRKITVWVNP
jgi:penicillin-binding protein 1A